MIVPAFCNSLVRAIIGVVVVWTVLPVLHKQQRHHTTNGTHAALKDEERGREKGEQRGRKRGKVNKDRRKDNRWRAK